ncbi:MAG: RNase adapter RapZ [Alphaproteobacteria bacterium]
MKLLLVTGMSAAGKSLAIKSLEDIGHETLDSIPLDFLQAIAGSAAQKRSLAVGVDSSSDEFSVEKFLKVINPIRKNPAIDFKLVFLDCDDHVLSRRLSAEGRGHPLLPDRAIMDGIKHERELITPLRDIADLVVDSSQHEGMEFRHFFASHFGKEKQKRSVVLTSFSFKRGVPREADFLFDVRFLKNPHYEPDLTALTGTDERVGRYIETDADFQVFFERLTNFLGIVMPRHINRERANRHIITVAVGCTGGRHRSVFVTEKLGIFMKKEGYEVTVRHRDIV